MTRQHHPSRLRAVTIAAGALAFLATTAVAQGAPPGGGQRTPPMVLTITGWPDGAQIPVKFTQAGEQVSPELRWTNVPAGTQSFVVNMLDPDVAVQRVGTCVCGLDELERAAGAELAVVDQDLLAARLDEHRARGQNQRSGKENLFHGSVPLFISRRLPMNEICHPQSPLSGLFW